MAEQPNTQQTHETKPSSSDVDQNKIFAVLAYFGILVLVPILAAKESKFAMYHANQGLVLLIADIVVWVGFWVLAFVMPFLFLLSWIIWLGLLVLHIIGIVNAAQGETKPVPIVGGFKILK